MEGNEIEIAVANHLVSTMKAVLGYYTCLFTFLFLTSVL